MKTQLTTLESEDFFYRALCNAVGTGYMEGYGLRMACDRSQYKSSQEHLVLTEQEHCYEDVLMQVLRDGGSLTFEDLECDGEYTCSVTMAEVHERVQLAPAEHLANLLTEDDDAETADVILQTVFFEDIIFG